MNVLLGCGFGIPLREINGATADESGNQCVWVSQKDCTPSNLELIKELLKEESVPINYWLLLAYTFKKAGHLDIFESLLKEAEAQFGSNGSSGNSIIIYM